MAGEEVVQVVESCFVKSMADMPKKVLWLSPLDLMLAKRGYTPLLHFYRPSVDETSTHDFFNVTRLKTALGKALVAFYPMAGRLRVDADGRLEIDCNGKGMLFLVAYSRLTVNDFSDFKPSPKLRRLFVPHMDDSAGILCATQVTFFKCGGVALGTAVHHGAMDGTAAFHFFQTWSTFSKDGNRAVVKLPYHDRTLLCARDPPVVLPHTLTILCHNTHLSEPPGPLVNKIFTLRKDQISTLKHMCGGAGVSTFTAVSAHMWRCMCLTRRLPPDSTTRLDFATNFRHNMVPPLPEVYFGNAMIHVNVAEEVRDVASSDMAYVARQIRGTISRVNDKLVRSVVDHLDLDMSERDKVPAIGSLSLPAADLCVVSWLGMPLYDVDFSWGKPLAMLRAEQNVGGVVIMMNSVQGDGSICLSMCIEAAILEEFERLLYARFDSKMYSKIYPATSILSHVRPPAFVTCPIAHNLKM